MTKEEMVKMFTVIDSFWPKSGFDLSNNIMLEWWFKKVKDLDWKVMNIALSKMVDNERYAPTLAVVKEYYANVLQEDLIDAEVGWGLVKKAIRNYGYSRPKEAIESLPAEVGQAVLAMGGWQSVCEIPFEEENTTRAQFRQCLNVINSKAKVERRTDANIKSVIASIRNENKPQLVEKTQADEIQAQERKCDTEDFESVEEVLRKLGLRNN